MHGLQRFRDLGFTAIWVTPSSASRRCRLSAAYHGYWGLDFTDVDPHLGSAEDFKAFTDCAHELGLKVILDVVVNHTADVVLVGPGFVGADERPYRDCRGKAFVAARYAGGASVPCLSAANLPRQATLIGTDEAAKKPAWMNDVTAYHDRGDIDFSSCRRGLLRAGGLLRARRPLHRAAAGRERPRPGVRRLDQALRDRRLPRRHGEARRPGVLRSVAAEDPGRRTLRPACRTSRSSARSSRPTRSSSPATSRPRPAERDRLPPAGLARPLRGRLAPVRAASPGGCPTTTTSAALAGSRRRRPPSSATTTRGGARG